MFFATRTDREGNEITTDGGKKWRCHAFDAFRRKLETGRPKKDDIENRAPMGKDSFSDLGVYWPPGRLTTSWSAGAAQLPTESRRDPRLVPGVGWKSLLITLL